MVKTSQSILSDEKSGGKLLKNFPHKKPKRVRPLIFATWPRNIQAESQALALKGWRN